jgi:hypothetical protein
LKIRLLIILFLFIAKIALCQQTRANSFICHLGPNFKDLTRSEIVSIICNSQFENFRLLNQRVTLNFDNGFDIILLSAQELQQLGLINDLSSYQQAFPPKYKLPVFHVNGKGQIAAAYPVNTDVKYSRGNR